MKSRLFILMLLTVSLTVACQKFNSQPTVRFSNGATVKIAVADDEQEREKGLMGVKFLPSDQGMLFVWNDQDVRQFWMKNTLIPLDMIFMGADKKIVTILSKVPPCEGDPCPLFPSSDKAQYVLEVNGGWAGEKGVKVGDGADIEF